MKFGDSYVGQPVCRRLLGGDSEPLGYISGIHHIDIDSVFVNIDVGNDLETVMLIGLIEPCKGVF